MDRCHVHLESHRCSSTVYVVGAVAPGAVVRVRTMLLDLPSSTRVVRVDLSAAPWIDSAAFIDLARALNAWRDESFGRVVVKFPERRPRSTQSDRTAANS